MKINREGEIQWVIEGLYASRLSLDPNETYIIAMWGGEIFKINSVSAAVEYRWHELFTYFRDLQISSSQIFLGGNYDNITDMYNWQTLMVVTDPMLLPDYYLKINSNSTTSIHNILLLNEQEVVFIDIYYFAPS